MGWKNANSTEFDADTAYPVVALVTEWLNNSGSKETRDQHSNLGGSMRLGCQKSTLVDNSMIKQIYQVEEIFERHRHRYEVNENYLDELQHAGLLIAGYSRDNLVEAIEFPKNRWFIGCQFHPELTAKPVTGHPLFNSLVKAAMDYNLTKSNN